MAERSPTGDHLLLRLDVDPFETLSRFIERVGIIDSPADSKHKLERARLGNGYVTGWQK